MWQDAWAMWQDAQAMWPAKRQTCLPIVTQIANTRVRQEDVRRISNNSAFFTGFHSLRGVRFHCTFLYAHHRLHPECVRPLLQIGATRQLPEDASLAIKTTFIAFTQTLHSHYPLVCKQRERSPSSLYLDVSIVWTARRIRFVLFVRTILQTATILQQAVDVPRQWGPVPWWWHTGTSCACASGEKISVMLPRLRAHEANGPMRRACAPRQKAAMKTASNFELVLAVWPTRGASRSRCRFAMLRRTSCIQGCGLTTVKSGW